MTALADGVANYLDTVRRAPGIPPSLETTRLLADRDAHRIAYPRPPALRIVDTYIVGSGVETPVRIYRPAADTVGAHAILYLHGGGFTIGSIASYDGLATALAEATGATILSVHYARLPESAPSCVLEQCYGVLGWIHRQGALLGIDPARIAVAGDSAGAFFATHLALLARDRGRPLACQLLCYGLFDLDPARPDYRASIDPGLPMAAIQAMLATYHACNDRSGTDALAPLDRRDLGGSPPAILLGAALDPLLSGGRDYAARLRDAGVVVAERKAANMCHGFLRAVGCSAPARNEMRWLGQAYREHMTKDDR